MKKYQILVFLCFFSLLACTEQSKTINFTNFSLTLPAGFKLSAENVAGSYTEENSYKGGYHSDKTLQNSYTKTEGADVLTLKAERIDVTKQENEADDMEVGGFLLAYRDRNFPEEEGLVCNKYNGTTLANKDCLRFYLHR
jgi:hypothetical protein